jgi:hypothetical protein
MEANMNTLAPPADVLFILAALITVGYIASCALWPYKACRGCRGYGQISGPFGGIRICRVCDGTGLRLRLGRRMWNAFRRLYRDINNRRHR